MRGNSPDLVINLSQPVAHSCILAEVFNPLGKSGGGGELALRQLTLRMFGKKNLPLRKGESLQRKNYSS
jgi:hypothetical protein